MKPTITTLLVLAIASASCAVEEIDETTTAGKTDAGTPPDAGTTPTDPCHGLCSLGTTCFNAECVSNDSCQITECTTGMTCNTVTGSCDLVPPPPAPVGSNCHRDGDCLSNICWSDIVGGQAICIERGACYGLELQMQVGHLAKVIRFHRADGSVISEETAPTGGTWYRAPNGACAAVPMMADGTQVVPLSCRGQWSWSDTTPWCNGGFADMGWPPALTSGCSWDGRHYGNDNVGVCSGPDDVAIAPVATP